jgi:hypothetical protein
VSCRDLGGGGRILIEDRLQNQTVVVVRLADVTHRIERMTAIGAGPRAHPQDLLAQIGVARAPANVSIH